VSLCQMKYAQHQGFDSRIGRGYRRADLGIYRGKLALSGPTRRARVRRGPASVELNETAKASFVQNNLVACGEVSFDERTGSRLLSIQCE